MTDVGLLSDGWSPTVISEGETLQFADASTINEVVEHSASATELTTVALEPKGVPLGLVCGKARDPTISDVQEVRNGFPGCAVEDAADEFDRATRFFSVRQGREPRHRLSVCASSRSS